VNRCRAASKAAASVCLFCRHPSPDSCRGFHLLLDFDSCSVSFSDTSILRHFDPRLHSLFLPSASGFAWSCRNGVAVFDVVSVVNARSALPFCAATCSTDAVRSSLIKLPTMGSSCAECWSSWDDGWCGLNDCLGSVRGRSRGGMYETTLADSEREAVADLLQYLENVRLPASGFLASLMFIFRWSIAHKPVSTARRNRLLLRRTATSSQHPGLLGQRSFAT
jgi:hypothetical protein